MTFCPLDDVEACGGHAGNTLALPNLFRFEGCTPGGEAGA